MFSCWMYFYEILTRTKTNRHSVSMLLITYKFWTQNLILPAVELGRNTRVSVCVCERVYAHAWAAAPHLLRRRCCVPEPPSSSGLALSWFSAHPRQPAAPSQQRRWQSVCITHGLLGFISFFLQTTVWINYWNIVHNKLEVCCSLPQIWLTVYYSVNFSNSS